MLDTLITSKTRLKLLLKFFLNPQSKGYLRSLEAEFQESTNGIRVELNRFESAGMLVSELDGNKKVFQANVKHPLFGQLQKIIQSYIGIDQIIAQVILKLGNVQSVYLVGDFARGIDAKVIDLILIGEPDEKYLVKLVKKLEAIITRKINCTIYLEEASFKKDAAKDPVLFLWERDDV